MTARADEVGRRQEARISLQMRVLRGWIILLPDARSSFLERGAAAGRPARMENLQSRYQAMWERASSERAPGGGIEANHPWAFP